MEIHIFEILSCIAIVYGVPSMEAGQWKGQKTGTYLFISPISRDVVALYREKGRLILWVQLGLGPTWGRMAHRGQNGNLGWVRLGSGGAQAWIVTTYIAIGLSLIWDIGHSNLTSLNLICTCVGNLQFEFGSGWVLNQPKFGSGLCGPITWLYCPGFTHSSEHSWSLGALGCIWVYFQNIRSFFFNIFYTL